MSHSGGSTGASSDKEARDDGHRSSSGTVDVSTPVSDLTITPVLLPLLFLVIWRQDESYSDDGDGVALGGARRNVSDSGGTIMQSDRDGLAAPGDAARSSGPRQTIHGRSLCGWRCTAAAILLELFECAGGGRGDRLPSEPLDPTE